MAALAQAGKVSVSWLRRRMLKSLWQKTSPTTAIYANALPSNKDLRWVSCMFKLHIQKTGTQRVNTIMLSGNGGQKIFAVPALDLVAVFTGASYSSPLLRLLYFTKHRAPQWMSFFSRVEIKSRIEFEGFFKLLFAQSLTFGQAIAKGHKFECF